MLIERSQKCLFYGQVLYGKNTGLWSHKDRVHIVSALLRSPGSLGKLCFFLSFGFVNHKMATSWSFGENWMTKHTYIYRSLSPKKSSINLTWFWENFESDQLTCALNVWAAATCILCVWAYMCMCSCVYHENDVSHTYRVPAVLSDQAVSVCPGLREFSGCRTCSIKTQKVPGNWNKLGILLLCAGCFTGIISLTLKPTYEVSCHIAGILHCKGRLERLSNLLKPHS